MHPEKRQLVESYLQYVQTYEQSMVMTEAQMLQYLSESNIVTDKVKEFIAWGEKKLKQLYDISFEPVKKFGRAAGERMRKEFQKGTKPEVLAKKVSESFKNFIISQAKSAFKKFQETSLTKQIIIGVLTFYVIVIINTFIMGLLASVLSVEMAVNIGCVIVAPIVEEAAKTFFIKAGMPWLGTGVVFGLEALMYISNLLMAGASIGAALIMRAAALALHFTTLYVQKKIIDENPDKESNAAYIAWATGVAIHSMWNLASVIFNERFARMLGIG